MKKAVLFIVLILNLSASLILFASAEEYDKYSEEYFAGTLFSAIDDETLSVLSEFGIDDLSFDKIFSISFSQITEYFSTHMSEKIKQCFAFFIELISIIMIIAAVKTFLGVSDKESLMNIIGIVTVTLIIISRLNTLMNMLLSTVETNGNFMLSFIPIFTLLISLCGSPASAVTYNSLTFALAQGMSGFINNLLLKFIGAFFCISVSLSINSNMNSAKFLNIVNKLINFVIGLMACGFTGLLTIKGITSTAVDAVSAKSVKFLLSSLIPIVGSSISDAYSSLLGSLNLIKSSVAIVGILVVLIVTLPAVLEGAAYCLSFSLLSYISEVFELNELSSAIRVFYSGLKLIILLNIFEVFLLIISTGVMLTVRGV